MWKYQNKVSEEEREKWAGNLFKNNSTIIVPIALNNKCIIAALLAFFPAPTDESKAVVVVPILPPNKRGAA